MDITPQAMVIPKETGQVGHRSTCPGRRTPSPRQATPSSTCSCGCPPTAERAGDVLLADSTIFSSLFGGESLRAFWRNIAPTK
ncbi:hypothetical protein [Streptosporangium sp. NPDC051022]|uniref:hypothetical protein n=1 Tax=Streptosporangium sp. NPDC051022 TaxID=3155752 RepID=UPI003435B8A6